MFDAWLSYMAPDPVRQSEARARPRVAGGSARP